MPGRSGGGFLDAAFPVRTRRATGQEPRRSPCGRIVTPMGSGRDAVSLGVLARPLIPLLHAPHRYSGKSSPTTQPPSATQPASMSSSSVALGAGSP
jgi:hypothetical protein